MRTSQSTTSDAKPIIEAPPNQIMCTLFADSELPEVHIPCRNILVQPDTAHKKSTL